MGKYLLRYLFFWIPAIAVYYLGTGGPWSQVLGWFFGFFLLFGWAVNTAMCAYDYPRSCLSALLAYAGGHVLILVAMYNSRGRSTSYRLLRKYGGLLSFQPLDCFVEAIRDFNIPHEAYILALILMLCLGGYIVGLIRRHSHPNPCNPRIYRV